MMRLQLKRFEIPINYDTKTIVNSFDENMRLLRDNPLPAPQDTISIVDLCNWRHFLYECDICNLDYPIWMVPRPDWEGGTKKIQRVFKDFRSKSYICKRCYEDFVKNPSYDTLDEYVSSVCEPDEVVDYRDGLAPIWNMPPQGTEAQRQKNLDLRFGKYHKDGAWQLK